MTRPALIIACDGTPPSFGAVSQYEMARARRGAETGRAVLLTGPGETALDETLNPGEGELRILGNAAPAARKGRLRQRAARALSMNARLFRAVRAAVKSYGRCEIKVTGSPPFFSCLVLLRRLLFWPAKAGGVCVTCRITDFYPETAFAAGQARALAPFAPPGPRLAAIGRPDRSPERVPETPARRERGPEQAHNRPARYLARNILPRYPPGSAPLRPARGHPAPFR
jgi:hypothetical protein